MNLGGAGALTVQPLQFLSESLSQLNGGIRAHRHGRRMESPSASTLQSSESVLECSMVKFRASTVSFKRNEINAQ